MSGSNGSLTTRDEPIWQYKDTISIRQATTRPASQRDMNLTFVIRGSHCMFVVFSVFDRFKIFLLERFTFLILFFFTIFSSPEHKVLRVNYCDRPLSVVPRRA